MHHSCGCGASFRRKISGSSHNSIILALLFQLHLRIIAEEPTRNGIYRLFGLSGIVIVSFPEAKSGLRYFALRFFRSESLRYSSNSARERGTEQNSNIFSSVAKSTLGGGYFPQLPCEQRPTSDSSVSHTA